MTARAFGRAQIVITLLILVLLALTAFAWIRAYSTCNGAVVKNAFDWPVCVATPENVR